jgi:pimeloyl-ACP methyl ester carboxylesterase
MSTIEERRIPVGDVTLHVALAGPEDGPLVVLLHGFPERWYGWERVIPLLVAAGLRVAAPDQRGYGESDKPAGITPYRRDRLAADVVGLIRALGRERAVVVGHDWGGAVAWWVAQRHPEVVSALVVVNCPHPGVMTRTIWSSWTQLKKSWYIFLFQVPWLGAWLFRRTDFRALRGALKLARGEAFGKADRDRYAGDWARHGIDGPIAWYRALLLDALLPVAPIAAPTTVVWGKQDTALGAHLVAPSVALCRQPKVVWLEDATHWVPREEPEVVAREVAQSSAQTPCLR